VRLLVQDRHIKLNQIDASAEDGGDWDGLCCALSATSAKTRGVRVKATTRI
jgi:hypothetical protein